MEIFHRLEDFTFKGPVILTQGTFDGVHLGHQKILKRLVQEAKQNKAKSVLLTFYPHPRLVLYPEDNELKLITTLEEKAEWLQHFGIDYLIVLPFTKELSRIKPFEFIQLLLKFIQIQRFIIGYDHRFGRNREGSIEHLKEYAEIFQFVVEEISEEDIDDCIISSSKIRTAILEGNFSTATSFLGREFSIKGRVIEGRKLGRTLGYPTANLQVLDRFKIVPGHGVYAVKVVLDVEPEKVYYGMLNLGVRPTFDLTMPAMEVHILDFTSNIYGHELKIIYVHKLREEIKFANQEKLKEQLIRDEKHTRLIFGG